MRPTSQVGALDGVASHAPTTSTVDQDILNTLQIYSIKILLLLFTSILATAVTLPILDPSLRLFGSLAKVGQCLLVQTNLSPNTIKARVLVLFWFIASFVAMQVYEQAMNADMVLTDYSSIVESLGDMSKHKSYRPVFVQGEFIREQFKRSLDPVKQEIWSRSNRYVVEMNPSLVGTAGKLNDVHIGIRDGVVAGTEFYCASSAEKSNNRKYLIGTKGFGVANLVFYYRENVTDETRQLFEYKSLLIAQGGHVPNLFKRATSYMALLSPNATADVIIRGDADALFAPIDYGTGPTGMRPTSQVGALDGVASHAPTTSTVNQEILNTLQIYSFKILLLLFTSILATAVTLPILDPSLRLFGSLGKVGQCLLNQPNLGPNTIKARALVLFWFIASFVAMEVYEQAMNADMVVTDYSSIVESLEDMHNHKSYRPAFVQGEFIREQFKRSSDPMKQEIWNRSNRYVVEMNPALVGTAGQLNDVHIGIRDGVVAGTEFYCASTTEKSNNRKYLIGTKGFGVANLAFYYRANVTNETMKLFDYKSLLIAQGGHVLHLFKRATSYMALLSPNATAACICYAKEELYDDVDTLQPIAVVNIATFFGMIGIMLSLAVIAFALEVLVIRLRHSMH